MCADGFVTIQGSDGKGKQAARVNKFAEKGSVWVQVRRHWTCLAGTAARSCSSAVSLCRHRLLDRRPEQASAAKGYQFCCSTKPPVCAAQVNDAADLKVGTYYDLLFQDVAGKFNSYMSVLQPGPTACAITWQLAHHDAVQALRRGKDQQLAFPALQLLE